jgi:multiple sugar transport system substrate-binding protein
MIEVEFSILLNDLLDADYIRPILVDFKKQTQIKVTLTPILWSEGWLSMANMALHGHGPDVSEIGTTWISNFAAMNAMRPFQNEEVRALGGAQAFWPALWQTGMLPGDAQVWAIPWVAFTQLLYYRHAALDQAGILDVAAAFANLDALRRTVEQLSRCGFPRSLGLTTYHFPLVVHEAASWIWSARGDFLNDEGKQIVFNHPQAIQGLHDLFSLAQFLVPPSSPPRTPVKQVEDEDAIIAIDGPWQALRQQQLPAGERLGVTSVPGVPCIGGTSLIVWKHSRKVNAAVELVHFLSRQVPQEIRLPARRRALQALAEQSPFYRTALASLERGLTFPTVRLWGMIEEKLIHALVAVWQEVLADPLTTDIDAILHRHLDPLARRLNSLLGG